MRKTDKNHKKKKQKTDIKIFGKIDFGFLL